MSLRLYVRVFFFILLVSAFFPITFSFYYSYFPSSCSLNGLIMLFDLSFRMFQFVMVKSGSLVSNSPPSIGPLITYLFPFSFFRFHSYIPSMHIIHLFPFLHLAADLSCL